MSIRLSSLKPPFDSAGLIDDRVMGGGSRSRLRYDPAGHAVWVKVVGPGRAVPPTMLGDAPLLTWMLDGLGMRRLISAWPADS